MQNNPTHYSPSDHLKNLTDDYYTNLIKLRNRVEIACDNYFQHLGAPKIDLFLISKSVSSPMGNGSDSLPISLAFGQDNAYLSDSAQFGMEPIVQGSFDMTYCYLPSFRGENSDNEHLNQFYHCEAELSGDYKKAMNIAEGLVKFLINQILVSYENKEFTFKESALAEVEPLLARVFPVITFDEASAILENEGYAGLIKNEPFGRVLSRKGEIAITQLIGKGQIPVWVTHYDRDAVAFYQKPDSNNTKRVLNADLLVPSFHGGFAGEILGLGQRQDSPDEILESMKRQGISGVEAYDWYINLRKHPKYRSTSGFGLGIERFLAWVLGMKSIVDVSVYPVIKDQVLT